MSKRIERVNSLIKDQIGKILLEDVDFPGTPLVTVTRVSAAPNLIAAKVYVSVMPEEKSEEVLIILRKIVYRLQQTLNKRLRMRPLPRIEFVDEPTTKEAAKVEEILEKIKNEEAV